MSGVLILVAALVYRESLSLPEGLYDPLGAGTLPRIIAAGIVLLSVLSALRSLWRGAPELSEEAPPSDAEALPSARPLLALGIYACTLGFAALLAFRIPYWACSGAFLLIAALAVTRLRRSSILPALVFAILTAGSVTYLFGSVFRVDLP